MPKKIPYVDLAAQHRPLKKALLAAAGRVIDSGRFVLGPEVEAFERKFAALHGVKHAVGVGNGTDALVLSLKALGIGPGDEVITAANSFVASAACVALVGATPVLADVRADYNIDPKAVEKAITKKTKAIIPVHLTGRPADMDAILALAKPRGIAVIEDAAQAVLAEYKGRKVGSFGTLGCFSLHPLKTLNALGDGGVITTNDAALAERLKVMRNLGLLTRENCVAFSGNSRLDALQAAMLQVKLKFLGRWTAARRRHAAAYRRALSGVRGLDVPQDGPGEKAVYHTFIVMSYRRDALKDFLAARGVGTAVHYPVPIHQQDAAKSLGWAKGAFPETERQAARILSLPVYPELSDADRNRVVALIREFHAS